MRTALTGLGIPCPRYRAVASLRDVEAFGFPCRVLQHLPEAGTTARSVVRRLGRRLRRRLRRRGGVRRRAAGRRPAGRVPVPRAGRAGCALAERPGGGVPGGRIHPARRDLPRGRRPRARPRRGAVGQVQQIALTLAQQLSVTGILAVELFETTDGRVLVNELAMRPHNTGHSTQDGRRPASSRTTCARSSTCRWARRRRGTVDGDGQHPRWRFPQGCVGSAVSGLPPCAGPRPPAAGAPLPPARSCVLAPKVGHVNAYGADLDDCLERARHAAAWFRGDLGNE